MADSYQTTEQVQGKNTNIAAAAGENPITATQRSPFFNHLEVVNSDNVKIEVQLDGDSTRAYFIEAKTAFILDVSEGQRFTFVRQINRDASTSQTADLIIFKAMHKVRVS